MKGQTDARTSVRTYVRTVDDVLARQNQIFSHRWVTSIFLAMVLRVRGAPVKLRTDCHNLGVETGRHDKIPLDERICPLCSGNKIEEETHLSQDCQRHSSIRDIFLSRIETKLDDIRKLSRENLVSKLMNSNDCS